jgi:hypothetical protein
LPAVAGHPGGLSDMYVFLSRTPRIVALAAMFARARSAASAATGNTEADPGT